MPATAALSVPAASVTSEVTPSLPPGYTSVGDVPGEMSVACVRGGTEAKLARFLIQQGYGFFNPLRSWTEWTVRGKRPRVDSLIPGHLFVAGGYDGRMAAERYRRQNDNHLYGWIGLAGHPAIQKQLRRELVTIERALDADPGLTPGPKVRPGVLVEVVSGPFLGRRGYVESIEAVRCTIHVRLDLLGQSVPVEIPRGQLEVVQD